MISTGGLRVFLRRRRRWVVRGLVVVAGLLVLAPLISVDPGVLALLLDVDLVVLLGTVGLGLVAGDLRLLAVRAQRCLPVVWVRVGVSLTREAPRTLAP
jgi:hypothetical protein